MGWRERPKRRGWWTGPLLAMVAGVIVLIGGGAERGSVAGAGAGARRLHARVIEVTDGDTVVVRLASGAVERVRYIGIDTPESVPGAPVDCFGHQASSANRRLVDGAEVLLRPGVEARDDYGRLLAYVYLAERGVFVNARLVARGYARTLTIAPNDARAPLFTRLEERAGRAARGLWSVCGT